MASGTRQARQDYGLAQAFSLNGKYVFFYSRPYHPHDTVFKVTTLVMSNNADRGIRAAMKKISKVAQERGVEFDGIITGQGQYDYAIKFK